MRLAVKPETLLFQMRKCIFLIDKFEESFEFTHLFLPGPVAGVVFALLFVLLVVFDALDHLERAVDRTICSL
jgi:hypothetical protein